MKRSMTIFGLILMLMASVALAQSFRGTIVGNVRDSSGAVLPGVGVTVTNTGTGAARTAVSSETGDYAVALLPPGTYSVTVALPGFKTEVRSGITLQVDQVARVDVTLQIGEISEKVEVIGDAPLINTESSTVGTVIENQKVVELPLNGRQFYQLNLLVPGATTSVQGSQNSTQGGAFVVNGAREQDNNFLIDGIDNNDLVINIFVVPLSVDAIQEFKLQSSSYTAEFGRSGGAQINVTTKSGTNDFHGTLFEFVRNDMFDARNFFAIGQAKKPKYRRNQFGASFGGPIRKNKTFFFVNTDNTKLRQGVTQTAHVPSLLERQGDFSASGTPIYDPQTYVGATNTRQPFPGNRVPADRINPVSRNIMQTYLPLPNLADPRQNFVSAPTAPRDVYQWTVKIDHKLPGNDDLFVRYTFNDDKRYSAFEPFNRFSDVPNFGTHTINRHMHGGAGWIHIFTPSLVNEARIGYNRFTGGIWQEKYKEQEDRNTMVGMQGSFRSPINFGLARMSITGYTNLGDRSAQNRSDNTYQWTDVISYTTGNHRFKAGADIRRYQFNYLSDGRESLTFTPTYTTDPGRPSTTGNAFADFLLGSPIRSSLPLVDGDIVKTFRLWHRTTNSSYYFQDDWKVHPHLTLNLGIRYELNTPVVSPRYRTSNFNPATGYVTIASREKPNVYETDKNNFAPRFGFAWTPFGNTRMSVRGGYGVFYTTKLLNITNSLGSNPPFQGSKNFISDNTIPQITIDSPFSGAGTPPLPSYTYFPPNDFPDGYVQQWSLNVGREVVPNLVVELGYVGTKGTKLDRARNLNQPVLGPGSAASRRPYPNIANITQKLSAANSSYNSLQVKAEKRLSSGLSFLSSYTWSKSIDNASNWNFQGQDNYNLRDDRALSDFDVRQRWSYSFTYELPVGHSRQFLSDLKGIGETILGGWQWSGILSLQNGNPITATISQDRAITGTGNQRPNRIGDPNLYGKGTPERWFNTDAFALPASGAFGNGGRNGIQGPPVKNLDLSLTKRVNFDERKYLQFRAEFFNLTNHPNFDRPQLDFDGRTTFGRILSANTYNMRQMQFGLKYYF